MVKWKVLTENHMTAAYVILNVLLWVNYDDYNCHYEETKQYSFTKQHSVFYYSWRTQKVWKHQA